MGKKDFDIEFDFEEEYGFDPKSFLGSEAYDDKIDLDAFSDEELGLTSRRKKAEKDAADDFDLDEELDTEDFLNMGSEEAEEEVPEDEDWADEAAYEDEEPELPQDEEAEETDMEENMEYTEEEELLEQEQYDEESEEEVYEYDEDESGEYDAEDEEDDEDEDEDEPVRKKARKPIQMPKINLPKITLPKLKTPNIFTKFYDLYFAPVLDKNWVNPEDPPVDPEKPRRRRKTKAQIFKEVYLPSIIACVCLVLVMTFFIGSLSNVLAERKHEKEAEQSRVEASISEAELAQQASLAVAAEAKALAAGYDYEAAIEKLDSLGNLADFPELAKLRAEYETVMGQLVQYQDTSMIPNLSFHVLIHDMAKAMTDASYGGKYNRNFVTTSEFAKILQQLYDNGYVLVDFDSFVDTKTDINGKEQFESGSMWLPADKKPIMITETMVNYYTYMVDPNKDGNLDYTGFANKLVLDADGNIKAEYIDASGQTQVGNYDLVPILEDFIQEHPDFSYRGARAIIAVTGDEGVFGYRSNTAYIGNKSQEYYDEQCAGAKKIAEALRNKGYTLASYTYKNSNYKDYNSAAITAEMGKWNQEVTSVIGPMSVFVFAQQGNLASYTDASLEAMMEAGFRYFISTATTATSATTTVNQTYVRQNRLMVTGNAMAWTPEWFTGMFNCSAVLETSVRGDVPNG